MAGACSPAVDPGADPTASSRPAAPEAAAFEHELFLVHAEADEPFVHGHLLPAIGLGPERVLLSSALALGEPRIVELERAVQTSRLTIAVLSRASMADHWAVFGEQLAGHAGRGGGRLVPLLLGDCDVPLRLDFRIALDFRDPARWSDEARRLRARLELPAAPAAADELPCPYPGMRAYSADTAACFHGRDAEIDELLGRLRAGERELYVIGPSGSGKTSLVAAGVVPRLLRGAPGLGRFEVIRTMRPGERPATRLAELLGGETGDAGAPGAAIGALLAGGAPDGAALIVIDQLEELFVLAGEDERARFLAALRALRAEPRCALVLALRADFYGALMESRLWEELHGRISRVDVAPLRGAALRAAIERPARDAGVYFEPELVERLLGDAAAEPGILPLLQETLIQLWDRRRLRLLALADYQALGDGGRSGLAVAIARRADATLRALTPAQEAIARRIFLRLVSFGEGRSDTRRQQPRSALRAAGDDAGDFDAVLRRLVGDRLLTMDGDEEDERGDPRVDLAHEVMIAAWPALAGWIRARRADEQRRRQLEAAAALWSARGRGEGGLLDPIELAEAEAWRRTDEARDLGESAGVAAFVAASRRAHERRQRRRRRGVGSAFGALAALAAVISALAIAERRTADEAEASRRDSQRLLALSYQEAGRQLVLEGRSLSALPYLVAARKAGEDGPPLRTLFWAATRLLPLAQLEHQGIVSSAAFSPDGAHVLTASWDRTARIWGVTTGEPRSPPLVHQDVVQSAVFSPDGTRVVTASFDKTARIWDATTGKPMAPPLAHQDIVWSAAFSPDGARAVTASFDRTARIWDATTGEPLTPPLVHQDIVWSAVFSPDGARVVTASDDRTARVWNAATGKPLSPPLVHQDGVQRAVFSPDGTRIVTASHDKTAQIWDAATGERRSPPLAHQGEVHTVAFSLDGTRVVTASHDRTARVWDARTGRPLSPPLVHQSHVDTAAFSPDGTRVVTASTDKTAQIWDATTGKPLLPPLEHRGGVHGAAFSPDGAHIVTASEGRTAQVWYASRPLTLAIEHQRVWTAAFSPDGARVVTASLDKTARVWDATTGLPRSPPLVHQDQVWGAVFSPDGARVVTASLDRTARVWDATTGQPQSPPLVHQDIVWSAVFSPDGARVVTASLDKTARVWDATTGQQLLPALAHQANVLSAAFSPDGSGIVTASFDKTARVWDATTGEPRSPPLAHQDQVSGAAFSPDGSRVVTASLDQTARVWDAATGRPLSPPLAHQGAVHTAAFSPDGTHVVTASEDNTARVWDAATGQLRLPPLAHQGEVLTAAFSPDGTRVVTASFDKTARVWDATTGKPLSWPLEHQGIVMSAVFHPDGTRVLTASYDDAAPRIWEIRFDGGTLAEWSAVAERSPYVLENGVLVPRASRSPRPVGD